MKEAFFLKKNADKWQTFEHLLKQKKVNPDQLAELFVELTDDLSFAKTNYPSSKVTQYLNGLTAKVHQSIYRNKRESRNRIITFWTIELPLVFATARKEFLYSFIILVLAFLVGFFSTFFDIDFVRGILGDGYVNRTIENIEKGDPMAVYKSMDSFLMFVQIMFNNIMVSFMAFAFGLFISFGTGYILFSNGVMLGSFLYFFYDRNVISEAMQTVWIHGTLEISAIVIAGGAGLLMGNSILFPKTYSRLASFKDGATRGLKIVIGLVPVFILAALLESFVTRLTGMPFILKMFIIFGSLVFVLYYYVWYPYRLEQKHKITVN